MSRSLFASWGARLAQEVFARAVAAVGLFGADGKGLAEGAVEALARLVLDDDDVAVLRLAEIGRLVEAIAAREPGLPPAGAFVAAFARFVEAWSAGRPPDGRGLRLEIDAGDTALSGVPDVRWLVGLLAGGDDPLAASAWLRVDEPDRPIGWQVPPRVAILGDSAGEPGDALAGASGVAPIDLSASARAGADCDLLLVADDLRGALRRVLERPRMRAGGVLVLGGAGVAARRARPLADALRSELAAAVLGIVEVDADRRDDWLSLFCAGLDRRMALDLALAQACRAVDNGTGRPPLLFAPRRALSPLAAGQPGVRGLAEVGEASALGAGRPTKEAGRAGAALAARGVVEAEPVGAAGKAAFQEAASDLRRVNFQISEVSEGASPQRVADRLAADRAYEIALFIGLPRTGAEAASEVFPSDRLPPSPAGHDLDVYFVPLVRAASGRLHTPQHARVYLPPAGDSSSCRFSFRTHGVAGEYRARVLVAHENRMIQTLLFTSPLAPGEGRFALAVENLVAPGFSAVGHGEPFDAAIVVNHASGGQPGLTTVVGQEVSFREPVGIDRLVGEVRTLLSAEASFPETRGRLDAPALVKLFDDLAHYGRSILKALPAELQGGFAAGSRVQIVEARAGAWLPVEILYGARLPVAGATLCPNARAALRGEASHESCAQRDDRSVHCPLRFWGLNCVIERQPSLAPPTGVDYTIRVPQPGADQLDAFRAVLVGASSKVRAKDLTDPGGLVEAVRRVTEHSRLVRNWDEWEQAVTSDSPSLLILLPHSQEDPAHPGIAGLEIGGVLLTRPELESSYVAGPQAKAPVVLLLGCSTQLTDVPFLNFVEAFRREQAALVIGTLATIRGRRAIGFANALLAGLKAASGSQRSFGEVFLETRRRLLAEGDGFALSLTAYGDVGWRV
ncbi:hypothetical protein [Accumulibacter sp.]|uniref:hypothetical protein n=1 Tax=Accumulibacter sp. TaxID=2053492 RepID=UPI0025D169B9|nr:hypothetical protein [Accumulibacter sp.]MCM8596467.1 hypothetical protein [Accumulibacter sp.]MCM8627361.1 hypothetical protein [Accumulibacter sp.]MDS4050615.1 hypothetical protein [Accumulibacter sp.]